MRRNRVVPLVLAAWLAACSAEEAKPEHGGPVEEAKPELSAGGRAEEAKPELHENGPAVKRAAEKAEKRFANLRQLTFSGENAEAYWSFDEKHLVFQSRPNRTAADQIFIMDQNGGDKTLLSTGFGRTTCSYFLPGDKQILYASTHGAGKEPPAPPDRSRGYVWALYPSFNTYVVDLDGKNIRPLITSPAYDAEATVSPAGDRIVFTSTRDGDIELYSCKLDGSDVIRLTNRPGYDGGAFFSWDGKKIVWRAPGEELDLSKTDYKTLLRKHIVRPNKLEIWTMNADGSDKRQITRLGRASFGPFWHPDNRRVIYSSNIGDPRRGSFELFLVDTEDGKTERVTYFERVREGAHRADDFDGFPMFTRDAKRLVFCSNRYNDKPNETNVFVVDWLGN